MPDRITRLFKHWVDTASQPFNPFEVMQVWQTYAEVIKGETKRYKDQILMAVDQFSWHRETLIECMMINEEVRESVRDLYIVKGLRINQV